MYFLPGDKVKISWAAFPDSEDVWEQVARGQIGVITNMPDTSIYEVRTEAGFIVEVPAEHLTHDLLSD